jgi:hypothetical protein
MKRIQVAFFSLFIISTLCISCSLAPPSDELIFRDIEEYVKGKEGKILNKTVNNDKAQILIVCSLGESQKKIKLNYMKYTVG